MYGVRCSQVRYELCCLWDLSVAKYRFAEAAGVLLCLFIIGIDCSLSLVTIIKIIYKAMTF